MHLLKGEQRNCAWYTLPLLGSFIYLGLLSINPSKPALYKGISEFTKLDHVNQSSHTYNHSTDNGGAKKLRLVLFTPAGIIVHALASLV